MWDIKQIITSFTRVMETNYRRLGGLGPPLSCLAATRPASRQDSGPKPPWRTIVRPITLVVDDYLLTIVTKRHAEGVRQTAVGGYNRAIEFTRVIPASHGLSGRQKDYVIVKIEIRLIKNQ